MSKDKTRYGQNFLVSNYVIRSILKAANIKSSDVVLEIGSGRGVLLPLLCQKAKKVISIELDKKLYSFVKLNFSNIDNLILKNEDGFKKTYTFTVFVSNLPYYRSKIAFEWLSQQKFSRGVIMLQKEFVDKILHKLTATSVLVHHAFDINPLINVDRTNFFPIPNVNSVLIKLVQKRSLSINTISSINSFFLNQKLVRNIFRKYNIKYVTAKNKLNDFQNNKIVEIAKKTRFL